MKTFAFFRGRPPVPADWKYLDGRDGWPTLPIVESLFGSFPAALSAAGLGTPADASATGPADSVGRATA